MDSLFITGATGFIGRGLIPTLDPAKYQNVYCLSRAGVVATNNHTQALKGDLSEPESYAGALASCRTVVHLAAVTGKAAPEEYFEVNARGTEKLIEQCELRGVENFLYVSTIAVKYPDKSRYYYAQSKELGEEAVRRSRLRWLIVRPTIVIGPGGGAWESLSKMARGPLVMMPGDGKTQIQPIALEDLVACLRVILEENLFTNETLELGGPEAISFERFLKKIHARYHGKEPAVLRLPIKPLIAVLSLMEKFFYSAMPVNVGQLSVFWQDSKAKQAVAPCLAGLPITGVDQMIDRMAPHE
ncbi:MAG: NAD-dependent epimerase/dehydratase family protein [Blastocatellales bacterium]